MDLNQQNPSSWQQSSNDPSSVWNFPLRYHLPSSQTQGLNANNSPTSSSTGSFDLEQVVNQQTLLMTAMNPQTIHEMWLKMYRQKQSEWEDYEEKERGKEEKLTTNAADHDSRQTGVQNLEVGLIVSVTGIPTLNDLVKDMEKSSRQT